MNRQAGKNWGFLLAIVALSFFLLGVDSNDCGTGPVSMSLTPENVQITAKQSVTAVAALTKESAPFAATSWSVSGHSNRTFKEVRLSTQGSASSTTITLIGADDLTPEKEYSSGDGNETSIEVKAVFPPINDTAYDPVTKDLHVMVFAPAMVLANVNKNRQVSGNSLSGATGDCFYVITNDTSTRTYTFTAEGATQAIASSNGEIAYNTLSGATPPQLTVTQGNDGKSAKVSFVQILPVPLPADKKWTSIGLSLTVTATSGSISIKNHQRLEFNANRLLGE
jgi:hypothetical protein